MIGGKIYGCICFVDEDGVYFLNYYCFYDNLKIGS